jgi:hypothetical protein
MLSAKDVLLGFMGEMNAWEKRCASRMEQCIDGTMDFDQVEKLGIAEYMKVFERYCSKSRATPRDFHYTEPPDYNSEEEVITSLRETSPGNIEIRSKRHFSHRKDHVFHLALENGHWKIVSRGLVLTSGEILESDL